VRVFHDQPLRLACVARTCRVSRGRPTGGSASAFRGAQDRGGGGRLPLAAAWCFAQRPHTRSTPSRDAGTELLLRTSSVLPLNARCGCCSCCGVCCSSSFAIVKSSLGMYSLDAGVGVGLLMLVDPSGWDPFRKPVDIHVAGPAFLQEMGVVVSAEQGQIL